MTAFVRWLAHTHATCWHVAHGTVGYGHLYPRLHIVGRGCLREDLSSKALRSRPQLDANFTVGEVQPHARKGTFRTFLLPGVALCNAGGDPGRFNSFPVQQDEHFLTVCRYVERNALTAKVVKRAEDWRWSSLWVRRHGPPELKALLSDWPVNRPRNWLAAVNQPFSPKELEAIRASVARNRPFGIEQWQQHDCQQLGLLHTLRSEGRPKKERKREN